METNPANDRPVRVTDENRVSMSLPNLMLQVPEIPGYVMHWFADRPGRISRAMAAGYEFVAQDEVVINNFGLAADVADSGNTDMGSRVSVHGGTDEKGGSERLYLMKIKQEWYDKDMKLREEASETIVDSLKAGMTGARSSEDVAKRYARGTENLFVKRKPKQPA